MLSRSQLHAVAKVRDAGLIASNLVVLPRVSNVSLANNGIHVSLGSRRLTAALADEQSGFGPVEEKRTGDLVIKIVEHYLPLFVGTYSAAPYRLDFADFHAERVLGFLPHELDFTHLRMLWRRWKKKASSGILGQPISPSGYEFIDRLLSVVFRLKGDFVPDFRLIDYLVAPLSTDESPSLDGELDNIERWKHDLTEQGVFDSRMSSYSLYRLRAFAAIGFSGFEGRHYSLCESLEHDLGRAVDLQHLITALAWQYVAKGTFAHADIPDDPTIESERRQIFFGTAIGLPTFFVRADTGNAFLRRVLTDTRRTRASHRYPGYVRVRHDEYRQALARTIRRDAAGLTEALGLRDALDDLDERVGNRRVHSAAGKLTLGILRELGVKSPLRVPAAEFNRAAEEYYRHALRRRHLREALDMLAEDWTGSSSHHEESLAPLGPLAPRGDLTTFLRDASAAALDDRLAGNDLRAMINLTLLTSQRQAADHQAEET